MKVNTSINLSYSPGVQSLIPVLYTAWADRVLSPSEIREIRQLAERASFLTRDDKAVLLQWGHPNRPPSPHLFKYWDIELKRIARQLSDKSGHCSLADLGIAMARQGSSDPSFWDQPQIREELEAIENSLNHISIDTHRHLFGWPEQPSRLSREEGTVQTEIIAELLDAPYQDIRDRMRILLCDPIFQKRYFPTKEAYREQVLEWLKLLAEQGLGSLSYPFAQGGQQDMGSYATVFEMLGYHDLSLAIKFGVQFGLFGGSIKQLGDKQHHDRYLEAVGKGELLGCFAMTETGHGSNVRGLETTITYDKSHKEFVVHSPHRTAGKEYIGNALHARMATVFGQLIVGGESHGIHAILVPLRDEAGKLMPGIEIEDCGYKMGLNGVDNGRIWFNEVRVSRENLLSRFGQVSEAGEYTSPISNPSRRFFTMLGTLVGGRVCVPRAGISAAKSGLTIAIRYALRRRQFGPRLHEAETLLLDYPSHQRRLMPLLAKAYACHFGLMSLSQQFTGKQDDDMREIETLAAGMKAYATWFTTEALQECREACGGKGYLSENQIDRLKADSDIFTTFEGDNTVLMQLVAKGLLSAFRKEFNEEGNWAVLRYLTQRVGTAIAEQNPFTVRNASPQHLRSAEFHLSAFEFRENRLLSTLAQRLRGMIKQGQSAYDAALSCQTHMIALAEAFIERVMLQHFLEKVNSLPEGKEREALSRLYQLYALHTIELHKGWYLESDYMTGGKTKAIRRQVDQLCAEVRKDAAALVEAFKIPEPLLAANILKPKP